MTVDVVRAALGCGRRGCPCARPPLTHCPVHQDDTASLSVHAGKTVPVVMSCKAGCPQDALIAAVKALGLWDQPESAPLPARAKGGQAARSTPSAVYAYKDARGVLVAEKGRWDNPDGTKHFAWRVPGAQGWPGLTVAGLRLRDVPLFGSELVATAPPDTPIWFVEGEKAALACRDQGLIAVTAGHGAGAKDFGDSLLPLAGRIVYLWPDNDEPGRQYMAHLYRLLRGLAQTVLVLDPPAHEPKDDAVDYFARGGTVAALTDNLPLTETAVQVRADGSIDVLVPAAPGIIQFTFDGMEKSTRNLDTELSIQVRPGGGTAVGRPYSQRINLLSNSARADLCRELKDIYGDSWSWRATVMDAITQARQTHLQLLTGDRYVDLPPASPDPQFAIFPFLPKGQAALLYGDGGGGKTYLTLLLAALLATGIERPPFSVQRQAVLVVDYETDRETFAFRMGRVLQGLGLDPAIDLDLIYWHGRGIPLSDQVEPLRRLVAEQGIGTLIVDSAAAACGGEPERADVALRYFTALQRISPSLTTLTVAHISKGGDPDYPFGSIFWRNQPRRTWYLKRGEQGDDPDSAILQVKLAKQNDGRKLKPTYLRITYEGTAGPVRLEPASSADHAAFDDSLPLEDRINGILRSGARTIYELVEHLPGSTTKQIEGILRRGGGRFLQLPQPDGRRFPPLWGLAESRVR